MDVYQALLLLFFVFIYVLVSFGFCEQFRGNILGMRTIREECWWHFRASDIWGSSATTFPIIFQPLILSSLFIFLHSAFSPSLLIPHTLFIVFIPFQLSNSLFSDFVPTLSDLLQVHVIYLGQIHFTPRSLSIPPKNIRQPKVFENSGMKWG